MAEIDKALPNISEQPEQTSEDLAVEMEQQLLDQAEESSGDAEIMENEDGSVDIDFDPSQLMQGAAEDHNANLADFLDEPILGKMGSELYQNYKDYKN